MNIDAARAKLRTAMRACEEALAELGEEPRPQETEQLKYMTPQAYARHRTVSTDTVYNWLKLGMPATRVGRQYRIPVARADLWVDNGRLPGNLRKSAAEVTRAAK